MIQSYVLEINIQKKTQTNNKPTEINMKRCCFWFIWNALRQKKKYPNPPPFSDGHLKKKLKLQNENRMYRESQFRIFFK